MTQNPTMGGEEIYDQELDLTGVTDFGFSLDDLLTGRKAIPLQGARFDLAVNGRSRGRGPGAWLRLSASPR